MAHFECKKNTNTEMISLANHNGQRKSRTNQNSTQILLAPFKREKMYGSKLEWFRICWWVKKMMYDYLRLLIQEGGRSPSNSAFCATAFSNLVPRALPLVFSSAGLF